MNYDSLKFLLLISTALIILSIPSATATLTVTNGCESVDHQTLNQFYHSEGIKYDDQILCQSQFQEKQTKIEYSSSKSRFPQSKRFSSLLSTIEEED